MPIANQAKETGVKYWQRLSQDWRREKTILRYWVQKMIINPVQNI